MYKCIRTGRIIKYVLGVLAMPIILFSVARVRRGGPRKPGPAAPADRVSATGAARADARDSPPRARRTREIYF